MVTIVDHHAAVFISGFSRQVSSSSGYRLLVNDRFDSPLIDRARATLDRLRSELMAERGSADHWTGCLSPSSLSTATAVSAMSAVLIHHPQCRTDQMQDLIRRGVEYLRAQQNDDGGFGDTDRSHSNIATSYLVLAATHLSARATGDEFSEDQLGRLQSAIELMGGIDGLRRRYGTDKTFVVPILCNLAIAGLVDWGQVAALPFEAAVFPQSMYRHLQMPVVSYAIPALVAIGQARHFLGPKAFWPLRQVRAAAVDKTMDVLLRMQPESGGYLEATPLTSFVVMNLAVTGRGDCEVAENGLRFIEDSITEQGSWPIDTNLATWVTSLSINALAADPADDGQWCTPGLVDWHLGCQHTVRHPFTGAEPGGWGWTDLSGAVPDSDDTPAAVIALSHARRYCDADQVARIDVACHAAAGWLQRLQNRNGGWPTFCRGWGKLPFDRSSTDLTAHALRAYETLTHRAAETGRTKFDFDRSTRKAESFLARAQRPDGSWLPLWFGNQDDPAEENPIYGTSRALLVRPTASTWQQHVDGCNYLVQTQNSDGGWGGGPSVGPWIKKDLGVRISGGAIDDDLTSSLEETGLAIEALSQNLLFVAEFNALVISAEMPTESLPNLVNSLQSGGNAGTTAAIIRGVEFLIAATEESRHRVSWPIGFYFAKLWYHEHLYPLIFSVAALGRFLRLAEVGVSADARN